MSSEQALLFLLEWHDYYLLAGTAAATLLGLLFIAVTLNADLILSGSRPHIKRVAEQAFQNYIAVLLMALFFMQPRQSGRVLASELLGLGGGMSLWSIYRIFQTLRVSDETFSRVRIWRRLLPSLVGYLTMIFAGWKMLHGFEDTTVRLFAFATILLLISATASSWDLLLRIAEIRHSFPGSGPAGGKTA